MKKIVIGLGFGDEGKGLVVDWLASLKPSQSVVRYSGGHQVGHCVRHKEGKHIFSNFGSGTIQGLPTIWNAKTCDPVGFVKEYKDIEKYFPEIWINPKCAITTPFDKAKNVDSERDKKERHGSIGVGFGSTIQREEDNYHLYFGDIKYPEVLQAKLKGIEGYYNNQNVYISDQEVADFFDNCYRMAELVSDIKPLWPDEIWESSQGLMLDMDYGIFPNVTRSRVGTQEIDVIPDDEIYLVTRAYQTRHGNGYCSRHRFWPNTKNETNVYNEFQGDFKTRVLDIDLINYAVSIDDGIKSHKNNNLVITCLDHMAEYPITKDGSISYLKNEKEFIDFIVGNITISIKKIFVSHGPTAENIKIYGY
jgi:adenylosuccinate synthase